MFDIFFLLLSLWFAKILTYPDFNSFHRRSRIRDCYKDSHAIDPVGIVSTLSAFST